MYHIRIVPNIYDTQNNRDFSPTEVIVRATSPTDSSIQFSNSECWAAWCRYGVADFRAISSESKWFLEWTDFNVTEQFNSLDQLIVNRRQRESLGLARLQQELGVKQNLRGMVQCLQ